MRRHDNDKRYVTLFDNFNDAMHGTIFVMIFHKKTSQDGILIIGNRCTKYGLSKSK